MEKGMEMFENYLDAQKDLAKKWQQMINDGMEQMNKNMEESGYNFNPEDYFKNITEWTMKNYENYTGTPEEFYTKLKEAQSAYRDLFNVWSTIRSEDFKSTMETSQKMYEQWAEKYSEQIENNYLSYMPAPFKKIFDDSLSLLESYRTATTKYWEPWIESESTLNDVFIKGMTADPKAYLEYLEVWKDNYEKTFSKFINLPSMGINREFLQRQSDNFDKFIKFSILVHETTSHINKIGQETMNKVVENYFKSMEEGGEVKSFEEFYNLWAKEIGDALDKLYFSDEFTELTGQTLKAMTELKIESDKLWEEYLSYYPIPKNSDMNSLYKTVNDLKREVRSLRKEINTLNSSINETTKDNESKAKESQPTDKTDKTKK